MIKQTQSILIALSILVFCSLLSAQESSEKSPAGLKGYRIVQYLSNQGYAPYELIWLDNNNEILFNCRSGKTKEQLEEIGIKTTDSQLRLLEIYDLLSVKDNEFKTAIPILDSQQTLKLRQYTKKLAEELMPGIKADVINLVNNLQDIGRDKNAYSILFSYILDGMIWNEFEARNIVRPRNVYTYNPFWAGEVWALYPDRSFSCGTNSWNVKPYVLYENWSEISNKYHNRIHKNIREISEEDILCIFNNKKADDKYWKDAFEPFGIVDQNGDLTIPVIEFDENNGIYRIAKRICRKTADDILENVSLDKLKEEYGFRDTKQALVIFYHEYMWDLIDALEVHSVVEKPILFTGSKSVTAKDLADVIFVVKNK